MSMMILDQDARDQEEEDALDQEVVAVLDRPSVRLPRPGYEKTISTTIAPAVTAPSASASPVI